jgi:hypothetical protein
VVYVVHSEAHYEGSGIGVVKGRTQDPPATYACQRCGGYFTPGPGRSFRHAYHQDGHARTTTLIIWCDECEGISP